MLDIHTALERLLETVEPMRVENVAVTDAADRIVAEDLYVTRLFPDSARGAVDGYALGSCENQTYTITLNRFFQFLGGNKWTLVMSQLWPSWAGPEAVRPR
jgi:molybdopterin biosynthesis enzyme